MRWTGCASKAAAIDAIKSRLAGVPNEFIVVAGPNDCGKETFLRVSVSGNQKGSTAHRLAENLLEDITGDSSALLRGKK